MPNGVDRRRKELLAACADDDPTPSRRGHVALKGQGRGENYCFKEFNSESLWLGRTMVGETLWPMADVVAKGGI
eukprot:7381918-Prymnesium_polylepis.1